MGKENAGLSYKLIAIEFLSVVFAVLLALVVNEWRESVNKNNLAEKAKQNIITEIKSNFDKLQITRDNHKETIDSLAVVYGGSKSPETVGNINFELLTTGAWETARITNALNYMNLEMVSEISEVYVHVELYNEMSNKLIYQMMFPENFEGLREIKKQIERQYGYLFNLLNIENQVLDEMKSFLEKHDGEN